MKLKEVTEGKVRIFVPDPTGYMVEGKFDPSWAPVFYNPKMTFNRDLSVIVVSILKPKIIVDALSATGIRGIRYYVESWKSEQLILNDKNPNATSLIQINAKNNGIENAKIYNKDANALLYEVKSDYIDIDPFGSPAPFILSSLNAATRNGIVAFTATDLSPLEGSSPTSCRRKYDAINHKLSSSKELGLRVLIGKIIREAAILEKTVYPLFSFYADYYYRLFVRVENGARKADDNINKHLKYFGECPRCGFQTFVEENCKTKCPVCGEIFSIIGPLYIGPLYSMEFLKRIMDLYSNFNYLTSFNRIQKLLNVIEKEARFKNVFYNISKLASKLKISAIPPIESILECLGDASRTHFAPTGIRTDKEYEEITKCIKSLR
ncbi:tRNA (guanine(26)-N(2))-dimethyltransferase [Saccharolobus solfataricus]|uniref:tRNA (guanine(26)-N(2))-dimethyltransferase n=3 Tax=Saccharolobus solfataricus TaxID=2287 RepID=TRM1_SACS2|nr:tRNA (guanine(26)-N(2))-dimethyltransferase [Saccharolobus solfataricus]Q97ZH0.1 RecName: Full=tRNA (guanine(26)-N(2))-dimethyltransferase; AltName: Full=tRNA 2,2-dimethylguanosine-26 methyltransferase; AltName: Full=tRNA(guanine-26,N(2)-N(2)) methyltransferase; AltName: Full=tRNA(m(2,2)G26)dimethyltransferase [Saccharolobus solfataricus P2]AAK41219.1 N2,N2 dimethylguanosine tRNA methyltransferase [Saccharolobus solfataricus P2]AKA74170.1 tRNA (guanine(26)-N(2))-dimethyltransferase [Saccharol